MSQETAKQTEPAPAAGVYEKFTRAMGMIGSVGKNGTMQIAGRQIAFVTHDDVMYAVTQAMVANGLAIDGMKVSDYKFYGVDAGTDRYGNPKKDYWTELMLEFDIVDNKTGDKIHVGPLPGCASDNNDKAPYKALSNAKKYAFMLAFGIALGFDVEADQDRDKDQQQNSTQQRQQPQTRSQQRTQPAAAQKAAAPANVPTDEVRTLTTELLKKLGGIESKAALAAALRGMLGVTDLRTADQAKYLETLKALNALPEEEAKARCNEWAAASAEPDAPPQEPQPEAKQEQPPAAPPVSPAVSGADVTPSVICGQISLKSGVPFGRVMQYFANRHNLTSLPLAHPEIIEEAQVMLELEPDQIKEVITAEQQAAA